jgi:hypothetical protein
MGGSIREVALFQALRGEPDEHLPEGVLALGADPAAQESAPFPSAAIEEHVAP